MNGFEEEKQMTLLKKTATELQSLLHNREVSVKELTEESLARIAKMDGKCTSIPFDQ